MSILKSFQYSQAKLFFKTDVSKTKLIQYVILCDVIKKTLT